MGPAPPGPRLGAEPPPIPSNAAHLTPWTKSNFLAAVFKELERREGIAYLKGSDTPYTGKVFILHENGQKKLQGNYKNGKRDGLSTPFHPISEPFNGDLKRLTQKANS
jgi:hypothetical protein